MKLMVASDLHGDAGCCEKLMEAWEREGVQRLFLLGDLLYHGPRNPVPERYDPRRVAALLNEKRIGFSASVETAMQRWIR